MSVFLLILKIIGITLLSVIGLLLLLILLVLFVPVRYKAEGSYRNSPDVNAGISWLLHIVSIRFKYDENGAVLKTRIFGIPVKKKKDRPVKEKKDKKKKRDDKPLNRLPQDAEMTMEGFDTEPEEPEIDEAIVTEEKPGIGKDSSEPEKKQSFFGKLKEFFGKVTDWILHFSDKVKGIFRKIVHIRDKFSYYLDLITDEKNKETLLKALQIVLGFLKHIRPRKWHVYFRFGFEEPDTTGKVLAILSMIYPWIGPHTEIVPEFEEKIIEAEGMAKGRLYVFVLLRTGWKLYFNKELRKIIRDFKNAP